MTTSTFIYFAYGSNMSTRRLRARTPSATPIGAARLSGYRLQWDKLSKDGSGKADCEKTGDPSHAVYGALYRIESDNLAALDRFEGAGNGYERVAIKVDAGEGALDALTYLATHKQPGLMPYSWYVQHVLVGAREFGLPWSYVDEIERRATCTDPDREREVMELAIYQDQPMFGPGLRA